MRPGSRRDDDELLSRPSPVGHRVRGCRKRRRAAPDPGALSPCRTRAGRGRHRQGTPAPLGHHRSGVAGCLPVLRQLDTAKQEVLADLGVPVPGPCPSRDLPSGEVNRHQMRVRPTCERGRAEFGLRGRARARFSGLPRDPRPRRCRERGPQLSQRAVPWRGLCSDWDSGFAVSSRGRLAARP